MDRLCIRALFLILSLFNHSSFAFQVGRHWRRHHFNERSFALDSASDPPTADDDIPSMEWLTDSLPEESKEEDPEANLKDLAELPFLEEFDRDGDLGDVPIPSTGISVADEMIKTQKDRFYTELVPIEKGMEDGVKAAQIVTTASSDSFEPVRYVLGLSKVMDKSGERTKEDNASSTNDFVMVDVPPFSKSLFEKIHDFIGKNGRLIGILVTSRDSIHYEDAPGVFAIRRADLLKWEKAFPNTAIFAYRLDIPRDCRESITQRLDGYGPFALEESTDDPLNVTFVETGRPLVYEEWDYDTSQDILAGKAIPPDDDKDEDEVALATDDETDEYSPEAIRARENGKRILAIYTPGRSFGSVSYVFPEVQLCASGFTIPIEDSRNDQNFGTEGTGPALDFRGYITTSQAGIARQMESARNLVESYSDRFKILLPSRGDPFFLDGNRLERQATLLNIVEQYEKVGKIYEDLGIIDSNGANDDL